MKQLVLTSILMLVVMAADTEEDMEITFTFQRYVDVKKVENCSSFPVRTYLINSGLRIHIFIKVTILRQVRVTKSIVDFIPNHSSELNVKVET